MKIREVRMTLDPIPHEVRDGEEEFYVQYGVWEPVRGTRYTMREGSFIPWDYYRLPYPDAPKNEWELIDLEDAPYEVRWQLDEQARDAEPDWRV